MFTFLSALMIGILAWWVSRQNETDRKTYQNDADDTWLLILHLRQDLKLVAFLLGGIIVMLGVVADRIY